MSPPAYAELHCLSDFSFGRGASSARELFERARRCGYTALAITDECSLAGIVRAHEAARDTGVRLIVGSEIRLVDGPKLVLLVENRTGYANLCELITRGRRASKKGSYHLARADLASGLPGTLALWLPGADLDPAEGKWLHGVFGDRLWLAVELLREGDDDARLRSLLALANDLGVRAVAAGNVHMHVRSRRLLQDALTAIRHRTTLAGARGLLFRNGERHLRRRETLAAIYPHALLDETMRIASRCTFSLGELRYHYPAELVPAGHTPTSWMRHLTEDGMRRRWPQGTPAPIQAQIEHELALIADLEYEAYFLTVHDIVSFARSQGILCQGRGSAANSAVCFALGITEVDPTRINLLVERFISRERNEPPDIDIDFEHERREEVIQYVYRKYGRGRAALAATVICYRGRSAVRDVASALDLPPDMVDKLTFALGRWDDKTPVDERLAEAGFDPRSPVLRRVLQLAAELRGRPRHLSQHVGGFVISDAPLSTLVPVENARMPDRTVIQWDKDDLDSLGLLKVDCLALGMLTCLRKCLDLLRRQRGRDLSLATIPADDPATWRMLQRADSIGVFQIESRAQMAMLPRLKPRCYYDLVIEVAIVRPGPIQGDMVHPYLRRRNGEEPVAYPSEDVRGVLGKTLGVPLFQEQAMKLAVVAAGYTPGEADRLRRSMAAWRRHGDIETHRERLTRGMLERGYEPEFAARLFEQLKGFGSYGFPESHAASFALLAWDSAWLKCHEPAAFTCALLNSLPMGFYSESQLVQDARRHGIRVLPVDVRASEWDCTLEPDPAGEAMDDSVRAGFAEARTGPTNDSVRAEPVEARTGPTNNSVRARLVEARTGPTNNSVRAEPVEARTGPTNNFVRAEPVEARTKLTNNSVRAGPVEARTGLTNNSVRAEPVEARTESPPWVPPIVAHPPTPQPALRLGFRLIRGFDAKTAGRIVTARTERPFDGIADLAGRAGVDARARKLLADAGALHGLAGHRHRARWHAAGVEPQRPLFGHASPGEQAVALTPPTAGDDTLADYASTGLTLGTHPLRLIRPQLHTRRCRASRELHALANGSRVRAAGLVTLRQRPQTASGVTFMTLEDEHGMVNVVVWRDLAERQRRVLLQARLMAVDGRWESVDGVDHLIAERLHDYSPLLGTLDSRSRDFR